MKRLSPWIARTAVAAAAAAALMPAHGADLVVNLTGVSSQGALGAPGNIVLTLSAMPGAVVDNLSWALNLSTVGVSWLSEATILIRNSGGGGVALQPGWGDDRSGSAGYAGSESLVGDGLSFNVLADGQLFVEFYETYDDVVGAADAIYTSGTLTLSGVGPVPEPGTYALMALGLLGLAVSARRRGH